MTTEFAARHTMDSPEWYSPTPIVEAARELMGAIELDPASHAEANVIVRAHRYFTIEDNGLRLSWRGRWFLNPPGGKDANSLALVPQFWTKLMAEMDAAAHEGAHFEGIWVCYSLEQLQTLQVQCYTPRHPLDFPMCIPKARIAFIENAAKKDERIAKLIAAGKVPNQKSQPSHANYLTYIGPSPDRFAQVFRTIGRVRL